MKALFNLVEGIDLKDRHAQLRLSTDEEYLLIEERVSKVFRSVTDSTQKVPLKNIISTIITTESELVERSKSAVGRGAVGGLLFGPAGLVLGGLSGVGKKKSLKKNKYFIISYLAADEAIKNITLSTAAVSNETLTKKFNKYISKVLSSTTPSTEVEKLRLLNQVENEKTEIIL